MYLVERLWAVVTSVLSIVSLSPVQNGIDSQQPLQVLSELPLELAPEVTPEVTSHEPFFSPPGTVGDEFKCDYTQHMPEWEFCSTPTDRRCWLRRNSDGKQYDINTNYEEDMPIGITRNYDITLHNGTYDADGMKFEAAKLFNGKYPGPWIEACWGDT